MDKPRHFLTATADGNDLVKLRQVTVGGVLDSFATGKHQRTGGTPRRWREVLRLLAREDLEWSGDQEWIVEDVVGDFVAQGSGVGGVERTVVGEGEIRWRSNYS